MKKLITLSINLAILFSFAVKNQLSAQQTRYTNPVINLNFPDPTAIKAADGQYYVYGTNGKINGKFLRIPVAGSSDLVSWEPPVDAMPEGPTWASKDFWAPHVIYDKGKKKYVLYYSGQSNDEKLGKCIGVATSKNPEGPFIDSGRPLITGTSFKAIDPMAFIDPATGKKWLYWGSGFEPLRVRELNDDMMGFKEGSVAKPVIFPKMDADYSKLIEGSWLHYRDGYYYLFYSGDNCCGDQANYAVMVARAKSPEGPFVRLGEERADNSSTILVKNKKWLAPGHNSVITDKAGQDWIVYHAIDRENPGVGRKMLMDKIEYIDGWPVINDGTPSVHPMQAPVTK